MKPAGLAPAAGAEWCQDLCLLLGGWEGEQAPPQSVNPGARHARCFQPVNSCRLQSPLALFQISCEVAFGGLYTKVLEELLRQLLLELFSIIYSQALFLCHLFFFLLLSG